MTDKQIELVNLGSGKTCEVWVNRVMRDGKERFIVSTWDESPYAIGSGNTQEEAILSWRRIYYEALDAEEEE